MIFRPRSVTAVFTLSFVVITSLIVALGTVLQAWYDVDIGNVVASLPLMFGAMIAGQRFAKLTGDRPTRRESWRYGVRFGLIALALTVALAAITLPLLELFARSGGWFAGFVVVIGGLYILGARVFFALGAKNQIRN